MYQQLEVGCIVKERFEILEELENDVFLSFLVLDKQSDEKRILNVYYKAKIWDVLLIKPEGVQELYGTIEFNYPGVPHTFEFIEDEECFYYICEYVQGKTLKSIIVNHGTLEPKRIIDVIRQLCGIILYLHTLEPAVVYHVITPGNIILTENGQVRIMSIDMLKDYSTELLDIEVFGVAGYRAPERSGNFANVDVRTDIFELGMIMYSLITGVNLNEPPYMMRPIRKVSPALPRKLERIICKCIALDPNERYQSCEELLYALNDQRVLDLIKRVEMKYKLKRGKCI